MDLPVSATGLERMLQQSAAQEGGHGGQFRLLDFTPLEQTTSFPCFLLFVETTTGSRLKLFLKDYSASRLPKDGLAGRIEREVRVYQDLLTAANLGTAACYGTGPDGQKGPAWLLLEYVPGIELRSCGFEAYLHAAAWLGKLHAYFHLHPQKLDGANYLVYHKKDFFADRARSAVQAVSGYGSSLAERLMVVLKDYDHIIDRQITQTHTLVHGSFRPQNILLVEEDPAWRVCPVDWELAGHGSQFFDLAFLTDGYQPPRLNMLLDAYGQELKQCGMPVPDRQALLEVLDCFRLHKMLKSLSDSLPMNFPLSSVTKILALAEKIRSDIIL